MWFITHGRERSYDNCIKAERGEMEVYSYKSLLEYMKNVYFQES